MANEWVKLDNAAKIFPPTVDKRDTKVFRFSCELTEAIDAEILNEALDKTLKFFPFYRSILKRGLFWYYLEISSRTPVVSEEHNPPCSPLYDERSKGLLFDVSFYRNRINLEVFHVLSDGSGALQFLRTLVYKYLVQKYEIETLPLLDYDASFFQKIEDSFQKNYIPVVSTGEKKINFRSLKSLFANESFELFLEGVFGREYKKSEERKIKVYRLHSNYLPERRLGVITGEMSVKAVLAKAKVNNATITVYLTAILLKAIHNEMALRHKGQSIVIAVPVDLRNYFESATARNFFSIIRVSYSFAESSGEFDDIIKQLKKQFSDQLTAEQLGKRIHRLTSFERNIFARIVPLQIKNIVLKVANYMNKRDFTCTLSNIGVVKMPEVLRSYIRSFNVFNSTGGLHICLVSHEDRMSISFSSAFLDNEIQKNFFRFLAREEIDISITSTTLDNEEEGGD